MPGKSIKRWDIYHALRRKGYSKSLSAAIANSKARGGRGKKRGKKGKKR